jgi:sigma-E factor negative regulatory protein RseC
MQMQEIGLVKKTHGSMARVVIKRHAACGDCKACDLGTTKLSMTTDAKNQAGAKVGDTVAVEMAFGNVMKATSIAYGIPLIAFLIGCVGGYFAAPAVGWDQTLTGFFAGLILTAAAYLVIHQMDKGGAFGKAYQPTVTEVLDPSVLDDPNR